MKLIFLVYLLILCFLIPVDGQSIKTQQGILFEKGKNIRLANLKILNKSSGITRQSDTYGVFNISAAIGDTLEMSGSGYQTNQIMVTDFKDQAVYLDPIVELKEVVITGSSLAEDLQAVQKGYRDKGVFYTGRPHYYYLFLKPMTFIYENFKSEVINARKWKKYTKREMDNFEVSKGFNDEVIKKYTSLTDAQLFDFEWRYAPTYEQAKNWSEYDFIDYIKKSYLKFKNPETRK